jgi:hypothetical protein
MNTLVSKDEPLKTSMPYVGYLVLKKLEKSEEGCLSLTEISSHLTKYGVTKSRPMMFALIFLHLAGLIDFRAPYIYKIAP